MASSDEDDLDALRNAALASMRSKQAAQEPQGIQVLSSIQSQPKPYEEAHVKPEDQFVSEFGDDVPFAFKQAVLQKQQSHDRGNWRGRHRGSFHQRGFPRQRGRGRGFFNIPPPNQSALIVIQVEQPEQKEEKSKEQRPVLLRPQDKWASGDSSSQSSPPRPKDTSKFRRYDDDTDSEDEDDPKAEPMDFNEEQDISGDLEDREMVSDPPRPDGDHHDIENLTKDKDNAVHALDNISDENIEPVVQESAEVDQPDVMSSTNISMLNVSNNCNVKMEDSGIGNIDISVDHGKDDTGEDSHEEEARYKESNNEAIEHVAAKQNMISLNDIPSNEGTPLRDEVIHEESVSNSYSSFSRFNRRNRRNTESGEDSDMDSDNEKSDGSNWSSGGAKFKIESSESEDDVDDAASEVAPDLSDDDIPITKHSVPKSPDQNDSISSSSDSSPSSSAPSSPSSFREPSPSPIKSDKKPVTSNNTQRIKLEKVSENVKRHSHGTLQNNDTESKHARDISRKSRHSPLSPRRGKDFEYNKNRSGRTGRSPDRIQENVHHTKKNTSPVRKRDTRRDMSPDKRLGLHKRNVSSPHKSDGLKNRKTLSPERKKSKYSLKESPIKADPEFDATNYRDKNIYKDGRGPSSHDVDKRNHKDYNSKAPHIKNDRIKAVERTDSNIRDKEVRHFKEVSMKDNRKDEFKVSKTAKVLEEKHLIRDELKEDKEEISYFKKKLQTKSGAIRQSKQTDLKGSVKSNDKGKSDSVVIKEKSRNRSDTTERIAAKIVVKKEKQPLPKSYALDEERMKRRKSRSRSPAAYRSSHKEPIKSSKHTNRSGEKKKRLYSPESSRGRDNQQACKHSEEKSTHKFDERSKKYREERLKRRSSDAKSEQKEKRKSIEERLKKIANIGSDSGSDSESDIKSISSLSDISSESESEAWRNKKSGASRNTVDIENERKRRRLQEQQNKKASGKESVRDRGDRENVRDRGDREFMNENARSDWHHKGGDRSYRDRHSQYGTNNSRRDDIRSSNLDQRGDSSGRERYYHRKNLTFYEEEPAFKRKPVFQEEDSDNDMSGSKVHRGIISVINKDSNKSKDDKRNSIPSLLDIKVSRTTEDKPSRKDLSKLAKKERLVIQVEKSSEDEEDKGVQVKSKRNKHSKRGKHVAEAFCDSEVEHDGHRTEQVVSVSFGEDTPRSKSSIYDRLGMPVSKVRGEDKARSRLPEGKRSQGVRKLPEVSLTAKGKKIRLTDSGKHRVKPAKEDPEDDALNRRIQQIQEKNAEILRRKKEIEQDKQRYG